MKEKGGGRSIFQKRNLICPEVCHGTRINSRALESRRGLRATARASIGCHSTFPLFLPVLIIERRRDCGALVSFPRETSPRFSLLSFLLSFGSSRLLLIFEFKKKKKDIRPLRNARKSFSELFREEIDRKDEKRERERGRLRAYFGNSVFERNSSGKYCPPDFSERMQKQELKDEHEAPATSLIPSRRSTSLCPKKNEKSPTHRFRMR